MDCSNILSNILLPLAKVNAQFPTLFFSGPNCTGQMYPGQGEFNNLEVFLTESDIGFSTIRSAYIPPQIVLQIWSPNQQSYYATSGQAIITETNAFLSFWGNFGGSPCLVGNQTGCGTAVNWSFGAAKNQISQLKLHTLNWNKLLHTLASNCLLYTSDAADE